MSNLILRNPHSVLAALETRPKDVLQITLGEKSTHDIWTRIKTLAQENGVPVSAVFSKRPGSPNQRVSLDESTRMGRAEAIIRDRVAVPTEELFRNASERSGGRGIWLGLDHLQDPQNLGSVFRIAAFFGIQGILFSQDRSAPLTSVVYDVASGGVEYVPFSIVSNLNNSFEIAKKTGIWILGASEHANDDMTSIPQDRPWLLVLGNEEKGMRRITEESCDVLCRITSHGKVTSLNVSVAAGILISRLI